MTTTSMSNVVRTKAISLVDNYLTYLALADSPLRKFDKSILFATEFVDLGVHPEDAVFPMYAQPSHLEFSWTVRALGDSNQEHDDLFALYENKTISPSEVARFRAKMPNGNPSFFECFSKETMAFIRPSGQVRVSEVFAGHRGKKFTIFDPGEYYTNNNARSSYYRDELMERHIRLMMGMAMMRTAYWMAHVALSEDSPRVSLLTDPTGVKELWKFRDIPDGAKRRDALLHWVDSHWRMNRYDPEVESYVREHMRGQRKLSCAGLVVEIEESVDDAKAVLRAISTRKDLKRRRLDRRKRKT